MCRYDDGEVVSRIFIPKSPGSLVDQSVLFMSSKSGGVSDVGLELPRLKVLRFRSFRTLGFGGLWGVGAEIGRL